MNSMDLKARVKIGEMKWHVYGAVGIFFEPMIFFQPEKPAWRVNCPFKMVKYYNDRLNDMQTAR